MVVIVLEVLSQYLTEFYYVPLIVSLCLDFQQISHRDSLMLDVQFLISKTFYAEYPIYGSSRILINKTSLQSCISFTETNEQFALND